MGEKYLELQVVHTSVQCRCGVVSSTMANTSDVFSFHVESLLTRESPWSIEVGCWNLAAHIVFKMFRVTSLLPLCLPVFFSLPPLSFSFSSPLTLPPILSLCLPSPWPPPPPPPPLPYAVSPCSRVSFLFSLIHTFSLLLMVSDSMAVSLFFSPLSALFSFSCVPQLELWGSSCRWDFCRVTILSLDGWLCWHFR